jgi:hypothetical protein
VLFHDNDADGTFEATEDAIFLDDITLAEFAFGNII